MTDNSSTGSGAERLRRHAERAERCHQNAPEKINGTLKIPIYQAAQMETGGGNPCYIFIFLVVFFSGVDSANVYVHVCVCVYLHDKKKAKEEVEDYV